MKDSPISIVYLATGPYAKLYRGFYESIENFLPNTTKKIHIYSDLDEYEFMEINGFDDFQWASYDKVINMPWPIIALEKFNIILDCIKNEETYPKELQSSHIYIFDASVEFRKPVRENIFKTDKLIGVLCYSWDFINHNLEELNGTESNSYGYINCDQYPYVCSGTMGGPIDKVKLMCETCMKWMAADLRRHIIPKHDDESYFTRYFTELSDSEKIVLPADFDYAIDDDWCPGYRIEDPYIMNRDDMDQQSDKWGWKEEKLELPINLPKLPNQEIKTFDQLRKDLMI